MPGTNFHENITSQTKIINVNASLRHSKMASFRKNKGILVQICNIHTSVTIQFTRLKFGNSPYLYSMNLYAKLHGFLKIWVSGPYYLMWNFPFCKLFHTESAISSNLITFGRTKSEVSTQFSESADPERNFAKTFREILLISTNLRDFAKTIASISIIWFVKFSKNHSYVII